MLNADTLTNKMPELMIMIRKYHPDVIMVNEVLPKNFSRLIHLEEFAIQGYDMVPHDNIIRNKGRGSMIYVKNSTTYKAINLPSFQSFEEVIAIEINLKGADKLICACVYRRGESTDDNNQSLLRTFSELADLRPSHLLIGGDLNFNKIDWESLTTQTYNPKDINNLFIECVRDNFLFQHITEPTRQRGTDTPSTLDIFTNEENMISEISINAPLGNSDHSIVQFKLNCYLEGQKPIIKAMYQKGNYKKMNDILSGINWEEEFDKYPLDVNKKWNYFKEKFAAAEAECVPRKMVYINGKFSKKFSVPLDSKNLKKLKRKNKLWNKIRRDLADEEEKLQYNRLKNQIRRLTRKGKKLYEKNIASNVKSNPKAFWQYTQSKLKTRSQIPDIIKPGTENNPLYSKNDLEKAEIFGRYFSSVFTSEPDSDEMPFFGKKNFAEELDNINVTKETVLKKLRKIKVNKSPGPDKLHPRVLREVSISISGPLADIFATSIHTKKLPDEWKHAHISVIFKKGKKTLPNNYRPVSLTCISCKILESIIRDHIINHIYDQK